MIENDYRDRLGEEGKRGVPRGAAAVFDAASRAASEPPTLVDLSDRHDGDPRRSPVLRVALVAVVLTLVAGTASAVRFSSPPTSNVTNPATEAPAPRPGQDGDARQRQLAEWIAGYDPAEIEYLVNTAEGGYGQFGDELLVATLEFRRTCRKGRLAADAARASTDDAQRASVVGAIMEPQLDRLRQRTPEGDLVSTWEQFTQQLRAGSLDSVEAYLASSCARSFGEYIDS